MGVSTAAVTTSVKSLGSDTNTSEAQMRPRLTTI
jgi:hypothetical protein